MESFIDFLFGKYIKALVQKEVKVQIERLPFTDFSRSDFERDKNGIIKLKNNFN